MTRATLCLAMIVKDEAHVLARCLASVRSLIDAWVVIDTGSSDATVEVAERALRDLPGAVHRRPFAGFGPSRTESLELARGRADYALVVDADDVLELPRGARLPELRAGAYALRVVSGDFTFHRRHLLRLDLPWRYTGVVHEVAVCDAPFEDALLEGLVYRVIGGGARARDPGTYARDAALLEQHLAREPADAHAAFHLAQSYRDAGLWGAALDAYERRAAMAGKDEEDVYWSLLQAASIREHVGQPRDAVHAAYLRAHAARPSRVEALVEHARYCRLGGEHALAHLFAAAAAARPPPQGERGFVDASAHRFRALDELALAASELGRPADSARAWVRLLSESRLPADAVERVRLAVDLLACRASRA